MIFIQVACFFIFGLGLANLASRGSENISSLKLGISPILTFSFFNILFIFYNLFKIPINALSVLPLFYLGALLSFYWMRNNLLNEVVNLKKIASQSRFNFFLIVFVFLLILGVVLGSYSREIWPGDGMGIWSSRAIEWRNFQSFELTDFTLQRLKHWMGYPIFHSLNLLFSSILVWAPIAYSVNALDFLPYLSVLFLGFHFFNFHGVERRWSLSISVLVAFGHRSFLNMMGAAYADPYLAYLSAVVFVLLTTIDRKSFREYYYYMIISLFYFSLLKNEGFYRAIIVTIPGILIYRQNFNIAKAVLLFLAPLFGLICAKVINPAPVSIVPYVDEITISAETILERIPIVIRGFYYMVWDLRLGVLKSSWAPISVVLIMTFAINFCLRAKDFKKLRELNLFVIIFFLANSFFNFAPLILTNLEGEVFNLPEMIGGDILQRLFSQSLYPLMLMIYLSLYTYRKYYPIWFGSKK